MFLTYKLMDFRGQFLCYRVVMSIISTLLFEDKFRRKTNCLKLISEEDNFFF